MKKAVNLGLGILAGLTVGCVVVSSLSGNNRSKDDLVKGGNNLNSRETDLVRGARSVKDSFTRISRGMDDVVQIACAVSKLGEPTLQIDRDIPGTTFIYG